jgi:hypothetical protein
MESNEPRTDTLPFLDKSFKVAFYHLLVHFYTFIATQLLPHDRPLKYKLFNSAQFAEEKRKRSLLL